MFRSLRISPLLVGLGTLAAMEGAASAQEHSEDLVDARNIGRAGTSTVSGDSGIAVVHNPAGMVRRSQSRLVLGTSIRDSDLQFTADNTDGAPRITDRSAPTSVPAVAYHRGSENGRWVLGALLWSGESGTALPTPAFGQPPDDVALLFPHRYAGTSYHEAWTQLAIAGAIRLGDSVGLGASVAIRDCEVSEERRIWAGFAGRDPLLGADRDLHLIVRGRDRLNPSGTLGLLVAPPQIPLEFAVATELRRGARMSGGAIRLDTTNSSEFPQVSLSQPAASLEKADSATVRGGVRYLGERTIVEVGVDATLVRDREPLAWSIVGVSVIDQSSASAAPDSVPSLGSERSHVSLRGAVDFEALPGFLWLTAGYAWHSPATAQDRSMPTYTRLGGHRLAAGLLAVHEDYALILGYSRRLARERDVRDSGDAAQAVNPFDAGTASVNAGRYRSASDQLGFALEIAW